MTATEEITVPTRKRDAGSGNAELRKFRPDIEGLRAVAVVLVVAGHSGLALKGGYIGVDVFFVISGFLITRQLYDELQRYRRVSFSRFYARRARRIVPAAAVVILATLLASWQWVSPLRMGSITRDAIFSAISGVNWRLAEQGTDYFESATAPSPLQHYWSLSVEEQFYAAWPLLLVISALVFGRLVGRRRAIVGSLTIIVALSLYLSITVTRTSAPWAYFGSHTRAWELGIGALIAVTALRWTRLTAAFAASIGWLGMFLIAMAAWLFSGSTAYPGSAALLPVIGAGLVIVAGCSAPGWGPEGLLKQSPMQFGGRVSYSWYLWHWPVLVIAPEALGHPLSTAETLTAIVASLVLAALTFYLVEQPIRARKGLIEYPQRGIGLGTALVAGAVAAAFAVGSIVSVPGTGSPAPAAQAKAAADRVDAAPLVSGTSAAVAEAATLKNLPAVTPALDKARADTATVRRCFTDYLESEPNTSRECVFGDPRGQKTMVLFGDSHAGQWNGPLQAWAETNHWQMWLIIKASCPPGDYPNLVVPKLHRVYSECNTWRDKSLSFIGRLKPDLVVLGSLAKQDAVGNPGMAKTVTTIRSTGAKVLFIADTPMMTSVIPDCLAQHPTNIQFCAVTPLEANLASPSRLAEIAGAKAGGATIFHFTPWLCTNETCPPVISNMVVYRDDGHLTNTYALSLRPAVGEAVTAATQ